MAIVCQCNVIKTAKIVEYVQKNGALTVDDVHDTHGCKVNCGQCSKEIERIIDETLKAPGTEVSSCHTAEVGLPSRIIPEGRDR